MRDRFVVAYRQVRLYGQTGDRPSVPQDRVLSAAFACILSRETLDETQLFREARACGLKVGRPTFRPKNLP